MRYFVSYAYLHAQTYCCMLCARMRICEARSSTLSARACAFVKHAENINLRHLATSLGESHQIVCSRIEVQVRQ